MCSRSFFNCLTTFFIEAPVRIIDDEGHCSRRLGDLSFDQEQERPAGMRAGFGRATDRIRGTGWLLAELVGVVPDAAPI